MAYTGTSETLEKDGGSAWQLVASLPSARIGVRGLGLDNGRFIVTGQSSTMYNKTEYTKSEWNSPHRTNPYLLPLILK